MRFLGHFLANTGVIGSEIPWRTHGKTVEELSKHPVSVIAHAAPRCSYRHRPIVHVTASEEEQSDPLPKRFGILDALRSLAPIILRL